MSASARIGFGGGAGVGGGLALGVRRGDGIEQAAAFGGDQFGQGFGVGQFEGEFFAAAFELVDMRRGGGAAFFPAGPLVADRCKAAGAVFAFALEAVECSARFAVGGARLGGAGAGGGAVLREGDAVAELLQLGFRGAARFERGDARLREAADFGLQRGELRGALGGGARGLGREVLRRDQRLVGVALVALGGSLGLARRIGGVLGGRVGREDSGAAFLGVFDFAVQRGETVALR